MRGGPGGVGGGPFADGSIPKPMVCPNGPLKPCYPPFATIPTSTFYITLTAVNLALAPIILILNRWVILYHTSRKGNRSLASKLYIHLAVWDCVTAVTGLLHGGYMIFWLLGNQDSSVNTVSIATIYVTTTVGVRGSVFANVVLSVVRSVNISKPFYMIRKTLLTVAMTTVPMTLIPIAGVDLYYFFSFGYDVTPLSGWEYRHYHRQLFLGPALGVGVFGFIMKTQHHHFSMTAIIHHLSSVFFHLATSVCLVCLVFQTRAIFKYRRRVQKSRKESRGGSGSRGSDRGSGGVKYPIQSVEKGDITVKAIQWGIDLPNSSGIHRNSRTRVATRRRDKRSSVTPHGDLTAPSVTGSARKQGCFGRRIIEGQVCFERRRPEGERTSDEDCFAKVELVKSTSEDSEDDPSNIKASVIVHQSRSNISQSLRKQDATFEGSESFEDGTTVSPRSSSFSLFRSRLSSSDFSTSSLSSSVFPRSSTSTFSQTSLSLLSSEVELGSSSCDGNDHGIEPIPSSQYDQPFSDDTIRKVEPNTTLPHIRSNITITLLTLFFIITNSVYTVVVSSTISNAPRRGSGLNSNTVQWTYIASSVCPLMSSLVNPLVTVLMGRNNELWRFIKDDISRVFGKS
eukprot:sb/3463026/